MVSVLLIVTFFLQTFKLIQGTKINKKPLYRITISSVKVTGIFKNNDTVLDVHSGFGIYAG